MTNGLGECLVEIAGDPITEVREHFRCVVSDSVMAHLDAMQESLRDIELCIESGSLHHPFVRTGVG